MYLLIYIKGSQRHYGPESLLKHNRKNSSSATYDIASDSCWKSKSTVLHQINHI